VLTGFSGHTVSGAALLLAIGVTATLAQLAMTRAYGAGRTLLTANLQYSAIVFASILGVTLFADRIPLIGWIGIGTIIGSGVLATLITARATASVPAPAPTHDAAPLTAPDRR
jgi:S-adenosylmethionine uptake transporter